MSQWTASRSQQALRAQQHAGHGARGVEPRPRDPRRPVGAAGFTIAHAGRQIRFGPVAFWIAVGTVVIMAGWSVVSASYFAFHDDLLRDVMARQTEQQYAYEDRIAELRAQIDRTTSRQLIDQDQLEQKLDDLLRRQATLESRATVLGGIADPATTGSIRPAPRGRDALQTPQRLNRGSMLEPAREGGTRMPGSEGGIAAKLASIEVSLDRTERGQTAALAQMQQRYEREASKVRGVLADLGLKPDAIPRGSGGPFVPVKLPPASQGFERALTRVSIARADAARLDAALVTVPVRLPVTGQIDLTSPFGVRIDPFLHVPAMHTGVDFRGSTGEPIHATAAGTVINAGWSGGYGKMVEIDHGNGLSTRYGHLSEIDVIVGQPVRIGQVIGRLGSTGRSTGPHLHYETRVDGEAVDPQKFLNAGAKLFGGSS